MMTVITCFSLSRLSLSLSLPPSISALTSHFEVLPAIRINFCYVTAGVKDCIQNIPLARILSFFSLRHGWDAAPASDSSAFHALREVNELATSKVTNKSQI